MDGGGGKNCNREGGQACVCICASLYERERERARAMFNTLSI